MSNLLELFSLNGSANGIFEGGSKCCSRSWRMTEETPECFDGIALSFEARYFASNQGLSNAWDFLAA